MTNLTTFTMNTLVSMINAIGGNVTAKTFNARSKAIARLVKIAAEKKIALDTTFDAAGNKIVATDKKISIRSVAEALLVQVDGNDLGLAYDKVLSAIKAQFPSAKTSVGCLRWYAVSMKEAGVSVPKRERATSK